MEDHYLQAARETSVTNILMCRLGNTTSYSGSWGMAHQEPGYKAKVTLYKQWPTFIPSNTHNHRSSLGVSIHIQVVGTPLLLEGPVFPAGPHLQ